MSIRFPLQTVLGVVDSATSGTVSYPFILPQDTDSFTVKVFTGTTFTGTSPTLDIYVQTSDDGGTTWYDMGNVGQLTAAIVAQNARFASFATSAAGGTRGLAAFIGSVAASTAATNVITGLPILSQYCRVYLKYGGTQLSNNGVTIQVKVQSQSATA